MNVLFCTDGSKISYDAVCNFSDWFKNFVINIMIVSDYSVISESVDSNKYALACSTSITTILDETENLLKEKGIECREKIKACGSIIDSILQAQKDKDYDLIILGSNGKKGLKKWLGSVSQEMASLSQTSLYIAKASNKCERILFTFDITEEDMNVINNSLTHIELEGKEIHLATVYEMPEYLFLQGEVDRNWIEDAEMKQYRASQAILDRVENMLSSRCCNITQRAVLKGLAAEEIIKYADQNNIDLIVMGMHPKKGYFTNSVSKRVLEHTKSDVMIIKL